MSKEKEEIRLDVSISDINGELLKEINGEVLKIPCEIKVPIRSTEPIEAILKPRLSEDNFHKFLDSMPFEFSFLGEIKDREGKLEQIVKVKKAYRDKAESAIWCNGVETTIYLDPVELEIIDFFCGDNTNLSSPRGFYHITPMPLLTPHCFRTFFESGEVKARQENKFKFDFNKDFSLEFEQQFKNYAKQEDNVDETRVFSELRACFSIEDNRPGFVPEFDIIDKFLLLTSFAERSRCVCTGWEMFHPQRHVRCFRKIGLPKTRRISRGESLIEKQDFPKFMEIAFPKLLELDKGDLFRSALYNVVEFDENIYTDFLRLFSSLESLILLFQREHGKKRIFKNDKEWKKFVSGVKNLVDDTGKWRLLKEKIPELQRMSLREMFEEFCEFYQIDLAGLWPVVNGNEGVSLKKIRDIYAHGSTFPKEQMDAVITAFLNLKIIVERSILSILGWPWHNSGAHGWAYTQIRSDYWEIKRRELTQWIGQRENHCDVFLDVHEQKDIPDKSIEI